MPNRIGLKYVDVRVCRGSLERERAILKADPAARRARKFREFYSRLKDLHERYDLFVRVMDKLDLPSERRPDGVMIDRHYELLKDLLEPVGIDPDQTVPKPPAEGIDPPPLPCCGFCKEDPRIEPPGPTKK